MTAALMDVAGVLALGLFIGLGWGFTRSCRDDSIRRFRVSLYLMYVLAVSFGVGFTRRELFPFHDWPLIAGLLPDSVALSMIVGVDASGTEWDIDHRAWEPIAVDDLVRWLFSDTRFFALDGTSRRRVVSFLLVRANAARIRALAGQRIGRYDRYLGPVAAPTFLLRSGAWRQPADVPRAPLVGLRWYQDVWWRDGPVDGAGDRRTLRYELSLPQ